MMDTSPITQALLLFAIVTVTTRFVLTPLARAGDGIATLFGPQSHALGWPRGVQESDEPWAWRTPQQAAVDPSAQRDDRIGGPLPVATGIRVESRPGTLLVPVAPVEAIRLRARPH
jgi:hypothetical protein